MNRKSKPLADVGAMIELSIDEIGARGDGIGKSKGEPVFVAFAAPGDRLKVRLGAVREQGRSAEIVEIVAPSPMRAVPACRHFGLCGGCALQHLTDDSYAEWKRSLVGAALSHRGFEAIKVGALIRTPPKSRRRANLKATRRGSEVLLGFYERASHRVVDVGECPVLLPKIETFIPPLRGLLRELLRPGEQAEIDVTAAASGLDMTIAAGFDAHMRTRTILARFGEEQDLARVNWLSRDKETPEPIVIRRPVTLDLGGVFVEIPPRAFLQPSLAGETALIEGVTAACAGAKIIADLYSGCGTFSFPLARTGRVHAFESDAVMAAAVNNAAKRSNLGQKVTAETRDLDRRPLAASDLDKFDAVVFDPPRPGAKRQAEEIARSKVPTVVAVSCNPASFARDARILIDGGYQIESVSPLDQFLWSPHVEVIAVFRK